MSSSELTVFHAGRCLVTGSPDTVRTTLARENLMPHDVLCFDPTGKQVDIAMATTMAPGGIAPVKGGATRRGRPRLGVTGREVTLLPRQWAWLDSQPGGASATLRRLVDEGRKDHRLAVREAQDATYRFMLAMAGNLAGYESALRALYARDREGYLAAMSVWPADIREHVLKLSLAAFPESM